MAQGQVPIPNPMHPGHQVHQELRLSTESFAVEVATWDPNDVATWARDKGFKEYADYLVKHEVSGETLAHLGEGQLREIGFDRVGPRLRFQKCLKEIQRGVRMHQRNEILWEAEEERIGPCGGCCPFGFPCCCCAQPPAHYKLNHYKLSLSEADVVCCGCCAQCLGYTFHTNNIDLDKVQDVDTVAEKPACCKGLGIIEVEGDMGERYQIYVRPDEVQKISQKIQMAVEEAELRSHAVIQNAPGQAF